MPEILHYLLIKSPPGTVYEALTERAGLAGWWTTEVSAKPVVNSEAEFRFGSKYHNKMKIVRLKPGSHVEWICLQGDPEWIDTTFTFKLEEKNGNTILRFSHGNWREATDFFASCNFHWGFYMNSLKNYCETGKGTPHQERQY